MAERQLKIDVIVEADGSITKIRTLDDLMSRLSDRTLAKVSEGLLTADDALKQLQRDADKTAESMARNKTATEQMVTTLGKFLAPAAILGVIQKVGEYNDKLSDLAETTQISVDLITKLDRASAFYGRSIDTLSSSVLQLQ